MSAAQKPEAIFVKRYAAGRLHDATRGRYVSLADLGDWAARGVTFSVIDARTGEPVALGRL